MTGNVPGAPAFRYPLPRVPLAAAAANLGRVSVLVELCLGGVLDLLITGIAPARGVGRLRALSALDALAAGIFVQGMDSAEPRISSEAGHRFRQLRVLRDPPTVTYEGMCTTDFARPFDGGEVRVLGEVDYRLVIRVGTKNPDEPSPDFVRELAAIGGLVLIGSSISDQPELRNRLENSRPVT
jgi:hypothetical protein